MGRPAVAPCYPHAGRALCGCGGASTMTPAEAAPLGPVQVEVAPGANPPVCRLLDFEEFLWSQRSKQQEVRRRQITQQRSGEVKQVGLQLPPFGRQGPSSGVGRSSRWAHSCLHLADRDPAAEWGGQAGGPTAGFAEADRDPAAEWGCQAGGPTAGFAEAGRDPAAEWGGQAGGPKGCFA